MQKDGAFRCLTPLDCSIRNDENKEELMSTFHQTGGEMREKLSCSSFAVNYQAGVERCNLPKPERTVRL